MKFAVSRSLLADEISKIQGIIPTKPAINILSNILLEAKDNKLTLSATDLTVSMKTQMPATILEEGSIALPAKRFFQLIRELTTSEIEINSNESLIANVISGTSTFKFNGMSAEEFPAFPEVSSAEQFTMKSELLREMFGTTAFAVARDDNRQVLNGTLMQLDDKLATFIGTDGKRLAKVKTEIDFSTSLASQHIIPIKAVEELTKILDAKESLQCFLLEDQIAIECGSTLLITKLLSGKYPDVEKVIPQESEIKIHLHKEELISLLRQISLFVSSQPVHFIFTDGELKLTGASSEFGEGNVSMPVDYFDETFEIAFNPSHFLDILRHSKDETVTIELTSPYNPGLITDSSKAVFVILPMRLTSMATA